MPEKKILKAPQEVVDLDTLSYPVLVSLKLDGIRCLIKNGRVHSASMRELPNVQIRKLVEPLLNRKSVVFDGELYGHGIPFGDISGSVRRHDAPLPASLKFNCFDCLSIDQWENGNEAVFDRRLRKVEKHCRQLGPNIVMIDHAFCENRNQLDKQIDIAKKNGYEGVMIRDPQGAYKHGRATIKQATIFKHKFWTDYDAKIISVQEMTGIKTGANREVDPTGHKKPIHKIEDRESKGTFGHFVVEVDIPGKPSMQIGNWKGCTDELRKNIWDNPKQYIGQWIRFKAMSVGQKDVPRIPKDVEFRDSKD